MNMMTLLLTFGILSSCVKIPYAPIHEVNFTFNRCLIKCYDYNKLKVVADQLCDTDDQQFIGGAYPVEACNQVTGPNIKFFAEELKPAIEFQKKECKNK